MTDFIEKIEDNRRWTNNALENTRVLLNIDCPICGKHEVCVRSAVFQDPTEIPRDARHCAVVVGCIPCGELMVWYADPDMTMDTYKDWINKALVYHWLDAVDKDPNIHAWKRDKLFDVANGNEPLEFWEHALDARLRSSRNRHRKEHDVLAEEEE